MQKAQGGLYFHRHTLVVILPFLFKSLKKVLCTLLCLCCWLNFLSTIQKSFKICIFPADQNHDDFGILLYVLQCYETIYFEMELR